MSTNENAEVEEDDIGKSDDEFDECITLGKSSPFEVVKWNFPDTEECPLEGCDLSFSNRLFAQVHFRLNHSSTAMLCTICNIPFPAVDASNLEHHYEICHPDASLPEMKMNFDIDDFLAENFFEDDNEVTNWNDDIVNDDLNGEENDWIQLSGCGKNSRWKFPSCLMKCPECSAEFDSRTEIIAHYKEKHSADVILCYLCDWPIYATDFRTHFRLLHPNDVNPFTFDDDDAKESPQSEKSSPQTHESSSPSESSESQIDELRLENEKTPPQIEESEPQIEKTLQPTQEHAIPEEYDKLVELSGCNVKTLWKFPNITHCPVQKCGLLHFADRMEAKRHYIKVHAEDAILCSYCDRPIVSPQPTYYKNHFKRKHPNKKVPFNLYTRRQVEPLKIQIKSTQANGNNSKNGDDDDDDQSSDDNPDDDLIKLKGCGIITYWQLPSNLNRCPAATCRMVFENNCAMKKHYKQEHAKNSVFCDSCGWPVLAKKLKYFQKHLRKTHPNMTYSYDSGRIVCTSKNDKTPTDTPTASTSDDDDNNDLVELSGGNIKTFWNFPKDITRCPDRYCHEEFADNTATLQHYRLVHAKNSYYCDKCTKAITVSDFSNLKRHFNYKHPDYKPSNIFGVSISSTPLPSSSGNIQKKKNTKTDDEVDDLIVLGKKCNQINYWRFPRRMTRCPSHRCTLDFGERSAAISHFRKLHADSYILCSFCAKPVYAPNATKLKAHFKKFHPLYSFENDTNDADQQALSVQKEQSTNDETSNQNVTEDEEDNDWVKLNGCGIVTYWRFPQTLRCPARMCSLSFQSRSDCKNHYQEVHAPHMILCPQAMCNKPLDAKAARYFRKHYQKVHAGVKVPYELPISTNKKMDAENPLQQNEHKTNGQNDQNNHYDDDEEEEEEIHEKKRALRTAKKVTEDDLIELNSCGIASRFRFPKNRTRCLNKRCNSSFRTRAETIRHYKEAHSMAAIYCKECQKPVHTTYLPYWQDHCEKKHPKIVPKAAANPKSTDTISMVSKSSNSEHSSKLVTAKIVCPLKGCNYESRRIHKLRKHWDKLHSDLRFPLIHEKQFDDLQHDETAADCAEQAIDQDNENNCVSDNDMDENLLVPMSDLPESFGDKIIPQKSPAAKRQRTTSPVAADVYAFDDHQDEIVEFRKHKLAKPSADNVECDGNVTSTAECLIDLGKVKVEINSPLHNEVPPEVSQSPMHPEFVLGEAHSLRPEDFMVHLESDDESFHSAESSAEIDESDNDKTSADTNENENVNKADEMAVSNDEMEVTTTVQDCNQDN